MFEKEYANINKVGFDEPVGWKKDDYSYIHSSSEEEKEEDIVSYSDSEPVTESESDTESDTEQKTQPSLKKSNSKNKPTIRKEYKCILQEETDYIYEKKIS